MPGLGPVVRKWLGNRAFMENLQGCTAAAIKASTSQTKTVRVPQFVSHDGIETYKDAYNESIQIRLMWTIHLVHRRSQLRIKFISDWTALLDWFVDGKVNECKLVSTMVHEFIHAVSHNATGLQAEDTTVFKGPGSYYTQNHYRPLWLSCVHRYGPW